MRPRNPPVSAPYSSGVPDTSEARTSFSWLYWEFERRSFASTINALPHAGRHLSSSLLIFLVMALSHLFIISIVLLNIKLASLIGHLQTCVNLTVRANVSGSHTDV